MRLILLCLGGLNGILSPAFAAKYVDARTNFTITHDADLPDEILAALTQKLDSTKTLFSRAKIFGTKRLSADVFLIRTATRVLLAQKDLNRVDDFNGEILKLWNDILIVKNDGALITMNRTDLTRLHARAIPVKGEGTDSWTDLTVGPYLVLKMKWEPSVAALAARGVCIAALSIANPLAALLPPYPELDYTSARSFLFTIGAEGSITTSDSADLLATFFQ